MSGVFVSVWKKNSDLAKLEPSFLDCFKNDVYEIKHAEMGWAEPNSSRAYFTLTKLIVSYKMIPCWSVYIYIYKHKCCNWYPVLVDILECVNLEFEYGE